MMPGDGPGICSGQQIAQGGDAARDQETRVGNVDAAPARRVVTGGHRVEIAPLLSERLGGLHRGDRRLMPEDLEAILFRIDAERLRVVLDQPATDVEQAAPEDELIADGDKDLDRECEPDAPWSVGLADDRFEVAIGIRRPIAAGSRATARRRGRRRRRKPPGPV